MNRLSASIRESPFIFHDKNDTIELVGKQAGKICHSVGDKLMHVAMSLVVDATIIVRGWQIIRYHNKIIGGASPNQYLDIGDKSKEEMVGFLKFCIDGKKGVVASGFKVALVSFQKTLPGVCPYFFSQVYHRQ